MKILLIQPPVEDFYDTDVRLQPIGLAYIKSYLKKHNPGVEVKILDFHHGHGKATVKIPRELEYLKPYWSTHDQSPFCGFNNFFRYGASDVLMRKEIAQENPDVVGISSLFSPYSREAIRVAEITKECTNAITVLGGSHVSADVGSVLRSSFVDFAVIGEGEITFSKLIQALVSGTLPQKISIPGLCYRLNGKNIINPNTEAPDLEQLPFPDLTDFDLQTYTIGKKPMTFLITSRSCPHRCSFCSVHNTFGYNYRRRSVDHIFDEIKHRYAEGYRVIDFEDDNLTFFVKDMAELCKRIINELPKDALEFVAMNGISYLSLNRELLTLMRQAGFQRLNLSLVTSDQAVLKTTKRPHTIEKYLEVVMSAFALGYKVTSYQILGLPLENLDSMIQTMVFAAQLPVLLGASPFYMTPNSPIAKNLNYPVTDENVYKARLTAMAIETENFSRNDIYTLFLTTRIINFLKSLPKAMTVKDLRGLEILRKLLLNGVLYADTTKGLIKLDRFNAELFSLLWNKLEFICNERGQRIYLSEVLSPTFLDSVPLETTEGRGGLGHAHLAQ